MNVFNLHFQRNPEMGKGARPPRAQFFAPSRKTAGAQNFPSHPFGVSRSPCRTRGAFRHARGGRAPQTFKSRFDGAHFVFVAMLLCLVCIRARGDATNNVVEQPAPAVLETARGLYNAGTQQFRGGKLGEAETLLLASVSKQDEPLQPLALYNLGHVRFAQGSEELKKSPAAKGATERSRTASARGAGAIQQAESALAGNDIQSMVDAYVAGRGARKELRAASEAVRRAMAAYGKTLVKWRRALSDFQSAAELQPTDTNASHNAEVVAKEIARLVDSLREMQQQAKPLADASGRLKELLEQLKGKIPAPNMPPGAPGGDDKDDGEDGKDGKKDGEGTTVESLTGMKEGETDGGKELGRTLSSDEAARLLDGLQPDGKLLPMGQGEQGKPRDRKGKTW